MRSSCSPASKVSIRSRRPFDREDNRIPLARFLGRILYYGFGLRPARRGGSAWWSVGLIGFPSLSDRGAPEGSGGHGFESRPRHSGLSSRRTSSAHGDRPFGSGPLIGTSLTPAASPGLV